MANKQRLDKTEKIWFAHDSDAATDPKMIAMIAMYGMAGYGMWWRIIELLRSQERGGYKYGVGDKFSYSSLGELLKTDAKKCKLFVDACINDFNLLATDGTFIWSDSLLRRMETWEEKKRVLSERGRKGAEATNAKRAQQPQQDDGTSAAQAHNGHGTGAQQPQQDDGTVHNITVHNSTGKKKNTTAPSPRKSSASKGKEFVPPTIEEVTAYFTEHGYRSEAAKKAYRHYSSGDWNDSKGNPVKNWKQKMQSVWFTTDNAMSGTEAAGGRKYIMCNPSTSVEVEWTEEQYQKLHANTEYYFVRYAD